MATKALTFDIFGRDRGAAKAIHGVSKSAGGAIPVMKNLAAATGLAFGVTAVVNFAKSTVIAASDLQEAGTAVTQVFGKEAAPAIKRFAASANTIGQSKTQALDAAKTFGIFGKAAGLSGQHLAGFSTDFVKLASDLASFNNTSPEQAIEALGAGLRGESEPLRKYGVLLDDATLKARAMKMGIYDGTGSLTQQQRVLAAQQEILAQTSTQQGDFARTSSGLANQGRINAANWENFSAKLGKLALPMVTAMSSFLNTHLIPALSRMVGWIQGDLVPAIQDFSRWVKDNVAWLGPLVAIIVGGVAAFKAYATVMAIVRAATAAWAAIQVVLNVALTANPIGIVIVAIGALVGAIIWIATQTTFFQDAWKVMTKAIGTAWNWVYKNIIKPVADWIGDLFKKLEFGIKVMAWAFGKAVDQIGGWFRKFTKFVGDAIGGAVKWFQALPGRILNALKGAAKWLWNTGRDIIKGLIGGVSKAAEGVWKTIKSVANNIINGVKKFFGIKSPSTVFAEIGGHLIGGMVKGIVRNSTQLPKLLGKVFGGVSRTVSGAFKALGNIGSGLFNSIFGGLFSSGKGGAFTGGFSRRGGAGQWAGLVARALAMLGQPMSLVPAVLRRINMESGGNPKAINLWDSNAARGTPSKGLMQTIDSTFNAYAGPFRSLGVWNPLANIYAGLNYALNRYGSIRAIDPLIRPIGYDQGGVLPPGLTLVANKTGKPEYVIPPSGLRVSLEGATFVMDIGGETVIGVIKKQIAEADRKLARTVRRN